MIAALRLCASGLAFASLTLPSIAAAKANCPVLSAVMMDDPAKLEGVAATINADGFVDVTKFGVTGILRGAEACSISAPRDYFDIDCDWSFESGDGKQAEKHFRSLRRQLDECLPEVLEQQVPRRYTAEKLEELGRQYGKSMVEMLKNREVLERFSLSIDFASGDTIELSISMTRVKDDGRTDINFNVYR